jgi:hypothetical protein
MESISILVILNERKKCIVIFSLRYPHNVDRGAIWFMKQIRNSHAAKLGRARFPDRILCIHISD